MQLQTRKHSVAFSVAMLFSVAGSSVTAMASGGEWNENTRLIEKSMHAADSVELDQATRAESEKAQRAASVRIALIGDSTCAAWGESSNLRGWGEFIGGYFRPGKVEVSNFAVGGISTQTFITEGHLKKVLKYKPNYVFIDLGINDSVPGHAGSAQPPQYTSNLTFMVQQLKGQGADVLFVNPHALNIRKNGAYGEDGLLAYRNAMAKVAKSQRESLLDLFARTRDYYNKIGTSGVKWQFVDTVHFTKAGANQAAAFVAQELKKSKHALKQFLN